MKPIFRIEIAESDQSGLVIGVLTSLVENKAMKIQAPNMRLLLREIDKHVKKRRSFLRRFPFVPRQIVTVEESLTQNGPLILPNGQ